MKKLFFSGIAIVTLSTAAFFATNFCQTDEFTPLQLANIEALATEESYSGQPCYSGGEYDSTKPRALVCDVPCVMKPWNPPLFGGVSKCQ